MELSYSTTLKMPQEHCAVLATSHLHPPDAVQSTCCTSSKTKQQTNTCFAKILVNTADNAHAHSQLLLAAASHKIPLQAACREPLAGSCLQETPCRTLLAGVSLQETLAGYGLQQAPAPAQHGDDTTFAYRNHTYHVIPSQQPSCIKASV
jgi:hypothetical protein